jgi:hypothetical protein
MLNFPNNHNMLSVNMLNVVMLSGVAPVDQTLISLSQKTLERVDRKTKRSFLGPKKEF